MLADWFSERQGASRRFMVRRFLANSPAASALPLTGNHSPAKIHILSGRVGLSGPDILIFHLSFKVVEICVPSPSPSLGLRPARKREGEKQIAVHDSSLSGISSGGVSIVVSSATGVSWAAGFNRTSSPSFSPLSTMKKTSSLSPRSIS